MWVSVSDVLPANGEFKVKVEDGSEQIAFYDGRHYVDKQTLKGLECVTHWFLDRETASPTQLR